jgi:hypothetical protein
MTGPAVGDVYEDRDPRSGGRVVRVIEDEGPRGASNPFLLVEVVEYPYQSWIVGRRSRLRAATLQRRYRKRTS